jgi:hypothetical protein
VTRDHTNRDDKVDLPDLDALIAEADAKFAKLPATEHTRLRRDAGQAEHDRQKGEARTVPRLEQHRKEVTPQHAHHEHNTREPNTAPASPDMAPTAEHHARRTVIIPHTGPHATPGGETPEQPGPVPRTSIRPRDTAEAHDTAFRIITAGDNQPGISVSIPPERLQHTKATDRRRRLASVAAVIVMAVCVLGVLISMMTHLTTQPPAGNDVTATATGVAEAVISQLNYRDLDGIVTLTCSQGKTAGRRELTKAIPPLDPAAAPDIRNAPLTFDLGKITKLSDDLYTAEFVVHHNGTTQNGTMRIQRDDNHWALCGLTTSP